MNLNKSLSLLTLVAFSASVAACGTPSNSVDLSAVDSSVSAQASKKADPYKGLEAGAVIKGEFIVKFKSGAKQSNSISGAESIKSLDSTSKSGLALVKMSNVNTNSVGTNSNILWSEPNRVVRLPNDIKESPSTVKASYMNDEKYSEQYSHQITHSEAGWDAIKNTKINDLTIAIVDTGVDAEHPDLKAKMVAGYDVYNPTTPAKAGFDPQGHGTHCAGIAGAIGNNEIGVAGVSYMPNIKIQPVRVLNDQGSGTLADVATGILWAGTHGAKVLSMSLGGPSSSKAMEDAVAVAIQNDVLVIAASGNSGAVAPIGSPANINGVMAVGATDSSDKIANFSQRGPKLAISAPGVKIMSTFPTYSNGIGQTNYGSISGTSMATPFVSGLAGLVRAVNPSLSAAQTRDLIQKSATDLGDPGFDPVFGWGRVDVEKTLKAAVARKK